MSKHLITSTRIFLLLGVVEAALAIYSLFLIPTDPKNAWLFGYSIGRWMLATFGILVMTLGSNLLLASFRVSSHFRNFLKILYELISTPLRWSIITLISLGGFSTSLTILISTLTYEFNTSYIRTAPILALASLLFLQFGILITYLYVKNGWHASIYQAEITTSRKLLVGLFLTSLIIRLIFAIPVIIHETPPKYDEIGYFEMATGIERIISEGISGNTPSKELSDFTYNDGKWPPLHPIILGISLFIFGNKIAVARLTVLFISAITTVVVYLLTSRISSHKSGMAASILHILYPSFIAYSHYLWSETTYIFFLLLAIYLITLALDKAKLERRYFYLLLGGLLLGMSGLVRTTSLPFLFILTAWAYYTLPKPDRKVIYPTIVFAACLFLWLPWLGYLQQKEGRFMPMATTGGFNLYLGNNSFESENNRELATSSMDEYAKSHFIDRDLAARTLAITDIKNDPAKFLHNSIDRLVSLWSPDSFLIRHILNLGYAPMNPTLVPLIWLAVITSYFVLIFVSVFGIIKNARGYPRLILIIFLVSSGMLLPMISISLTRLHIPLLAVMLPAAGAGITSLSKPNIKRHKTYLILLSALMITFIWVRLEDSFSFYQPSSYYANFIGPMEAVSKQPIIFSDSFLIQSSNAAAHSIIVRIISPGYYFDDSQSQSINVEFIPGNKLPEFTIISDNPANKLKLQITSTLDNRIYTISPIGRENWLNWEIIENSNLSIQWLGSN